MSIMFTPSKIGNLEIKNRFIHSAVHEGMAEETGEVTEALIKRYIKIADGETGLIIPGIMNVHPLGKVARFQTSLHSDEMIPGLKKLAMSVKNTGAKIFFQLGHSGSQTMKKFIGDNIPMGPSNSRRDPLNMLKPIKMTEEDLEEVIESFGKAARRAAEAGADGIQLHAAHGYLISQFLSPFLNDRNDQWGGSEENRFRLLKKIYQSVKQSIPGDMPVIVKLNWHDFAPKGGIDSNLSANYCRRLSKLGIEAIEISCALGSYSFMNLVRGQTPVWELIRPLPMWQKPLAWIFMKTLEGKYDFEHGYNVQGAQAIRPAVGKLPIILVGGMRSLKRIEEVVNSNTADFISMGRPFIREPFLIKSFKEGTSDSAACISCNKCFAAVGAGMPARCYVNGVPKKLK